MKKRVSCITTMLTVACVAVIGIVPLYVGIEPTIVCTLFPILCL